VVNHKEAGVQKPKIRGVGLQRWKRRREKKEKQKKKKKKKKHGKQKGGARGLKQPHTKGTEKKKTI